MAAKKAAKKTANKVAKKAPAKAAKKGAPQKKPEEYLIARSGTVFSVASYTAKPAVCFLTQVVEAKNSFDYAKNKFSKKGQLSIEATDNLQQITGPLFAAAMGHFETFQKSLFAGLFEISRLLKDWDSANGFKSIGQTIEFSSSRMAAYRGHGAQVGLLFADSLSGWHSPSRVREHFKCFDPDVGVYSNKEVGDLEVLWQIRHTLVHTGGWLTLPDAQKVKRLIDKGDTALAFNELFMLAFTRLMHRIVKESVGRLETKLRPRLRDDLDASEQQEFDDLLKVDSPSASFFPK
jgi:hypothetical protein